MLHQLNGLVVAAALIATIAPATAKEKVKIAYIANLSGGGSHIGLGGETRLILQSDKGIVIRALGSNTNSRHLTMSVNRASGSQVATRVASDNSFSAAIAHYCSAVAMATVGVFHKFKMPMLVYSAIAPEITDAQKFAEINRIGPSAVDQNRIGPKFVTGLGYKTFAVIHDTTAYGVSNDKYFTPFMEEAKAKNRRQVWRGA